MADQSILAQKPFILGATIPPCLYMGYCIIHCFYPGIFYLPSKWPLLRLSFIFPSSRSWSLSMVFSLVLSLLLHSFVLILLSVLGVFCIFLSMSATSAWCCIRASRRKTLCALAISAATLFDKNKIDFHVAFGTVLGATRLENGVGIGEIVDESGMIPWEHDVDFGLNVRDYKKAYESLKKAGFKAVPP